MPVTVKLLTAEGIQSHLTDLARLRIEIFRDWPYLYDGDLDYEQNYLASLASSSGAAMVAAFDDRNCLVGAATGAPLADHDDAFAGPLIAAGYDPGAVFYCAESLLLPAHRGQRIGHMFFDLRETHARALRLPFSAFCAVIRPENHPARPPGYFPLDGFWERRGYRPLEGAIARYAWRDVGETTETTKPMQAWIRTL